MLFPTFWAFGWRCSSNINELIAILKFDLLFDIVTCLFDLWPWNTTNLSIESRYICGWKIVKICQSVRDLCVKMCYFHLNMNIEGWFCRQVVTSLVTSSEWKYFFLDYLHTIVPYPMSNWGYLWKFLKSWNFQKWRKFEVVANLLVGSVTGNWVCYLDNQVHYLHFELLIDAVAQILMELW